MTSQNSPESNIDPFDQLQAVDPAKDAQVSDDFVASVLAQTTTPAPIDLAAERVRRSTRFLPWIAAGAAAVLFGTGGYAIGAIGHHAGVADKPVISVIGTEGGQRPQRQESAAAAKDSMYMGFGGRTTFTSDSLSTETSQMPVYWIKPPEMDDARAKEIAALFGVTDPLTRDDYGWSLPWVDNGPQISFNISTDVFSNISYYDGKLSPSSACYNENQLPEDMLSQAAGEQWTEQQSQAVHDQQVSIDECMAAAMAAAPSGDAAKQKLVEVMKGLGVDPSNYQITSANQKEAWEDGANAQASLMVDGQLTDVSFNLTLAKGGLVNFNGNLGTIENAGTYQVISAQEAFGRLTDPRFGPMGGRGPIAYASDAAKAAATVGTSDTTEGLVGEDNPTGQPVPQSAPPVVIAPNPGSTPQSESIPYSGPARQPVDPGDHPLISWPVTNVHITGAQLGLSTHMQGEWPNQVALLVPFYTFTDSDQGTWSMIALTDADLDFTPVVN